MKVKYPIIAAIILLIMIITEDELALFGWYQSTIIAIQLLLMAICIVYAIHLAIKKTVRAIKKPKDVQEEIPPAEETLPIQGAYQRKWMFTYNEKDAYSKLKPIAEELGYTVFAKVRLLDLLEPTKGTTKYKTYFYKVQAKHVDFVLCDAKLVARYIIELDDSSHEADDRKKRDQFVDEVAASVGYKIIHTRSIDDSLKTQITPCPKEP